MILTCGQCGHHWNANRGFQCRLAQDAESSSRVRCTLCRAEEKAGRLVALLDNADRRVAQLRSARFRRNAR